MLNDEPDLLKVDLLQFTTEGCESKGLFLSGSSTFTSPTCLAMAPPPKVESQVSMTMEVSELLLQVALDTSGQTLGSSTPKRAVSLALGAPPSLRLEGFAKPVEPPLRCPHRWASQMMLSQMIWPLKRFPFQLKLQDWALVFSLGMWFNFKKRWVRPWEGYWLLDPPSMPTRGSTFWTLRWPSIKMSWKLHWTNFIEQIKFSTGYEIKKNFSYLIWKFQQYIPSIIRLILLHHLQIYLLWTLRYRMWQPNDMRQFVRIIQHNRKLG